ncbi:phosphoenolpyruvate--protein phosphotransferase [Gracilimonas sp. BCB1]|uniref:phosphoenolpyruvate--protein phosphotransferase n=1 Tax=Gracilimonas sp. BCB1 TaxID=3152362 RepID=UPI0032D947AB
MEATNTDEITIKGRSVGTGVAIGKAVILSSESKTVAPTSIKKSTVKKHKQRFLKAKESLIDELQLMADELNDTGSVEIIDTQKQIILDAEIERSVFEIIEEKQLSVDFAIYQTYCQFIERLKESGSELFRQRIVDLEDIRDRFIDLVCDQKKKKSVKKGALIVAREISPTDLVSYYEDGAIGLVMEKGGVTSHAAIIAKSLGIPCIVSAEKATKEVLNNKTIVLDAAEGTLILNPSRKTISRYRKKVEEAARRKKKRPDSFETADGFPLKITANIEFEPELPRIKEHGAEGIGLLRTESLLFGHKIRKSTEEQLAFYSAILEGSSGPVTIRLFDIGGDKTSRRTVKEANPFLGWRGIRLLLDEKELLQNQLKAIVRTAAKYPGRIRILVPMVSVIHEVNEIKDELESARKELKAEGIELTESIPIGLMVEVPSVALSAYSFAKKVDFLSVGTNDLTQYTMAVDRGNERICNLFQHYHPSVLQLIKMTVEGADKAGVDVSVCGELAGDEIGAACLIGMGIQELSMVPESIPAISELLHSKTKEELEQFASSALELGSTEELEQLFEDWKN